MPLITNSVKKRVDNIEETNKEQQQRGFKSIGCSVSDLVMLIHKKQDAKELGDIEQVKKLNNDYPILQAISNSDEEFQKSEERLRKHFRQHPVQG